MKELSSERRALLAAVLSLLVIVGWSYFFTPKTPPGQPKPAPPSVTTPAGGAATSAPGTSAPQGAPPATPSALAQAPTTPVLVKAAAAEKSYVVENGLYRVEFSNRGAVVRSWQLKKYQDDAKPPHTLDLVHPDAAKQTGGWPFALVLDDPQQEAAANSALFLAVPGTEQLEAPAEIAFEWSDGHLAVEKRLKFEQGSYIVQLETNVTLDGKPLSYGVAWRGGFGDWTVYQPAEHAFVFASAGGKLNPLQYKKLAVPTDPAFRRQSGAFDYAGIEDQYFAAAFLPRAGTAGGLAYWQWKQERDVVQEGKPAKEPVVEMAAGSAAPGAFSARVFVGAKDFDDLKRITPPLSDLIQFGWLEFIAAPLFYLLRWLHNYLPNYGWAIVAMTVLINMALYPLKKKSYRSMQMMQKVGPEIKAIQERYKKYSLRDPRKQQMNQEVMAVYQREGINPMSGCLIMLPQMPIWFGLYRMLGVTIELRHAHWVGWITDLSAKDPYYILPVLMAVTMYAMQKMTPVTTTDAAQQRMMTFMPLAFGAMFIIVPVSSGLVLYIFTSNLVNMAQQWFLNRNKPADVKAVRGKNGKKK